MDFERCSKDSKVFQNTNQDSIYKNFRENNLGNGAPIEENVEIESILVERIFQTFPEHDAQFEDMVKDYLQPIDILLPETAQSDERESLNDHNENKKKVSEDVFLLTLDIDKKLSQELGELTRYLKVGNKVEIETDDILFEKELDHFQEFEISAPSFKRMENHSVSSEDSPVQKKRKVEDGNIMKIPYKDKKSFKKSEVGTEKILKTKNQKSKLDFKKNEITTNAKENIPEVKTKVIEAPPMTEQLKKNIEGQYNLHKPDDYKMTTSERSHKSFTTISPCIAPSFDVKRIYMQKTVPSPNSVKLASSEASNKTKSQCIASKILKRIRYDYSKLLLAWCSGNTCLENTIESLLTDLTGVTTMVSKKYSFSGWENNTDLSRAIVLKFLKAEEASKVHRMLVFRSRESIKTLPVRDLLEFTAKLESSYSNIASSSMTITTKNMINQSTAKDLELCAKQYGDIKFVLHLTERQLDIKFACVTQGILASIALDNTYLGQMGHLSTTMKKLSGNKVIIPEVLKFIEKYLKF